jgi:hypothetical protein
MTAIVAWLGVRKASTRKHQRYRHLADLVAADRSMAARSSPLEGRSTIGDPGDPTPLSMATTLVNRAIANLGAYRLEGAKG